MQNQSLAPPFDLGFSWNARLKEEFIAPYMVELAAFIELERAQNKVYPPADKVFTAFHATPFERVRVVIVGQDPYHGPGQAHGLCFSVPRGIISPPSLKNIFRELEQDVGIPTPKHGCLESWAEQGVLLLNTTLTVASGAPLSHAGRGWEPFTDAVLRTLANRQAPLVFVLWGGHARKKCANLPNLMRHRVFESAHPSPLSAYRGFLGCRHFSHINRLLLERGEHPIDWSLN